MEQQLTYRFYLIAVCHILQWVLHYWLMVSVFQVLNAGSLWPYGTDSRTITQKQRTIMNYHELSWTITNYHTTTHYNPSRCQKKRMKLHFKASLHHAGEALQLGEVAVVVPPANLKLFGLAVEIPWDMLGWQHQKKSTTLGCRVLSRALWFKVWQPPS